MEARKGFGLVLAGWLAIAAGCASRPVETVRSTAPAAPEHPVSTAPVPIAPAVVPPAAPAVAGLPNPGGLTLAEFRRAVETYRDRPTFLLNADWERRIDALDPADMPAAMDAVESLGRSGSRVTLASALFTRWGEIDGPGAVRRALTISNSDNRGVSLDYVFQGWGFVSRESLAQWALAQPAGESRSRALKRAIDHFAADQPKRAIDLVRQGGWVDTYWGYGLNSLLLSVASEDFAYAVALRSEVPASMHPLLDEALARAYGRRDHQAGIAWLERLDERAWSDAVARGFIAEWAQRDVLAAFNYAIEAPPTRRLQLLAGLNGRWEEAELAPLSEWFRGLQDPQLQQLASLWLTNSFKDKPGRGFLFLAGLGGATTWTGPLLDVFLSDWARTEPEAADRHVLAMPRGPMRDAALVRISDGVGRANYARGSALVEQIDAQNRKAEATAILDRVLFAQGTADEIVRVVLSGASRQNELIRANPAGSLAGRDPDFLAELSERLPAGPVREAVMPTMIRVLAARDPEMALRQAERLPEGEARTQGLAAAAQALLRTDPARAAVVVQTMPLGSMREEVERTILAAWMSRDVDGAFAWAGSAAAPRNDHLRGQLILRLASQGDPERAALLLAQLQNPETYLGTVAAGYARKDPEKAFNWVLGFPASQARDNALAAVIEASAGLHPVSGAGLAARIPNSSMQLRALQSVGRQWALTDPKAAARWSETLTMGVREPVVQAVATAWLNEDPEGAINWAMTLEAPQVLDRLLSNAVTAKGGDDFPRASRWIAAIGQEATRLNAAMHFVMVWGSRDSATTEVWIRSAPLNDDSKDALLLRLEQLKKGSG